MSHCGLGLSCEPDEKYYIDMKKIIDTLPKSCIHSFPSNGICNNCAIEHRFNLLESKVKELESEIKRFKSFDDSNNMILSNLLNSKKELEKTLEKLEKEQLNIKSSVKVHWDDREYFYHEIKKLKDSDHDERIHEMWDFVNERLDKLEHNENTSFIKIHNLNQYNSARREEIKECNINIDKLIEINKSLVDRVEKLESKVDNKSDKVDKIQHKVDKVPHKCPVCDGNGKLYSVYIHGQIATAFQNIDAQGNHFKNCHICQGKGIVWS